MIRILFLENEDVYNNLYQELSSNKIKKIGKFELIRFNKLTLKEIKNLDYKKIYIININLTNSTQKIVETIRKYDWNSEIIATGTDFNIFEKTCKDLYSIFSFVKTDDNYIRNLILKLNIIINKKDLRKKFIYSKKGVNLNIYNRNIYYIYRDTLERKIVLVTKYNSYYLNETLKSIKEYLGPEFIQCHRACIINKNNVEELNWAKGYFVLVDGSTINLLSKKYNEVF